MLRFRSVVLLAVCVICAGHAAVAQPPFIESYYPGGEGQTQNITSFDFVDIVGTEKTFSVPAGRAVIFWTLRANVNEAMIRPMIGSHAPDPAAWYFGGNTYLSGTWTTNTEGGTLNVKLQGALLNFSGSYLSVEGTSWTLMVFPNETPGAPAVGGVGLVVMVVLAAIGSAFVFRRGIRAGV